MDKLPPEIRLLIYRELLRDEVHYLERQRKNPSNEPCESKIYPAVLGVCKQIYSEASAVLYEENIFGYDDRNEDTVVDGKTLYHGDNPPKGPFNRIKHLLIRHTTQEVNPPRHTARKLTAVVKHVLGLGCSLKTLFLQLQLCADDEGRGAAAGIAQAKHSLELIEALALLNVNKQFRIYLETDQISDCKVVETFANEIGLLKGWAITLKTWTLLLYKDYKDYIKNDEANKESDEEESNEEESDEEESDEEESNEEESNEEESDEEELKDEGADSDHDERIILDYVEEHDNWNKADYIWTWTLQPATVSTKETVPTTSGYCIR